MPRHAISTIGPCIGALFVVLAVSDARGDDPLKLRWIPRGTETAMSGAAYRTDYSYHVRMLPSTSYKPEDRYYAVRGIRTCEPNTSVNVVPAFLHPNANKNIQTAWFAGSSTGNMKSVELPEGYLLSSAQVCTDKNDHELKGVRIWGHKLDPSGRPITPTGPQEFTRDGCKKWGEKVSCATGTIAQSIRYYAPAGISLVCSKAEPAVGVWNAWSAQVVDGYFKDATGKIHATLRMKNETHTTGVVEFADIKLMSGGDVACQTKTTSPSPQIPSGYTKDSQLDIVCDWEKIKKAGGCRVGDTCNVKFKGVLKARVDDLLEEHPYSSDVVLKHIP